MTQHTLPPISQIILCSGSPRRRELLTTLGLPFEVALQPGIQEAVPPQTPPLEVAQRLAETKAEAYTAQEGQLLITADTVVVCHGQVLGKPHSPLEATEMLQQLAGRTHQVVTGVCLKTSHSLTSFSEITDVTFAPIEAWEVECYVRSGAPMDKAGAYGVQEWVGVMGVTALRGSYTNVMGLPTQTLWQQLKRILPRPMMEGHK